MHKLELLKSTDYDKKILIEEMKIKLGEVNTVPTSVQFIGMFDMIHCMHCTPWHDIVIHCLTLS